MANIRGFIFDMDGVITETSENHYLAWKVLASNIGIYIDRSLNEQLKGVSRMASLEVILKHGGKENDYSDSEKLKLATKKNHHYVDMISRVDESDLLEGILELLIDLKKEGYRIAIASASHSGRRLVELLGIEAYIDYIVDPSTVESKPEPDIFLEAAKGIQLKPVECIGIEDAIAGVEAIKAAGMIAVGIGDKTQLSQADIVYKKPSDINVEEILRLSL